MEVNYEKEDADPKGLGSLGRVVVVILFLMVVLAFAGCTKAQTYNTTHRYQLPEGLKDCKVFYMVGEGSSDNVVVVRCPNSQTSTEYNRTYYDPNTNIATTVSYHAALVTQ